MALYIVLMGIQGAGKGTQAAKLAKELAIPAVSSGDLFREMKSMDTPLAREVQEIMRRGELVPDDVTLQVVGERLSRGDAVNGVILDGFPRTRPQAEALDKLLAKSGNKIAIVPVLELEKFVAIKRAAGRWTCSQNKEHVYNVYTNPPQVAGHCDIDNAPLTQRADDTPEAVEKRINLYHEETAPLLDYYAQRGLVHKFNADQPIEKVTEELLKAINGAMQGY
jgi:adenylate kinase